jgi:hypothetical protein
MVKLLGAIMSTVIIIIIKGCVENKLGITLDWGPIILGVITLAYFDR